MAREIRISKNPRTGKRVVQIHSLAFISDCDNGYSWLGLHYRHFRIKLLLRWARKIYVPDCSVAIDLIKYYFYPKDNIVVDKSILLSDKPKHHDTASARSHKGHPHPKD